VQGNVDVYVERGQGAFDGVTRPIGVPIKSVQRVEMKKWPFHRAGVKLVLYSC